MENTDLADAEAAGKELLDGCRASLEGGINSASVENSQPPAEPNAGDSASPAASLRLVVVVVGGFKVGGFKVGGYG